MRNTAATDHAVEHEDHAAASLIASANNGSDQPKSNLRRLTLVTSTTPPPRVETTSTATSIVERYRRREAERHTSSVYDPTHAQLSPSQLALAAAAKVAAPMPVEIEQQLIAVLKATPMFGETIEAAFTRKENEARALMSQLTVMQARTLHGRLKNPSTGDELTEAFGRMVASRRDRLLAFLADARRREALTASRRTAAR